MTVTRWEPKLAVPGWEDRDHFRGSAAARVTLVEYGDFECPYSGKAYAIVKTSKSAWGSS
jgi:hypothetical protein